MVRGARPRGMSIGVVLAIVAVLMLIASTMVAVCLMNLNFTQQYYNGSIAQNEAEAGVSALLYSLADDRRFGLDERAEIRGRLTEFPDPSQCYHVVTFQKDAGFPYSVNNSDGSHPIGDRGRAVPSKMIHAFSTGYCGGQYRTVEVLIERPPFPWALAVESRIRSANPVVVEGTESVNDFIAGKKNRPGHICSNYRSKNESTDEKSVYIGEDSSSMTFISGMVRACGGVEILNGKVLGGVTSGGSRVDLPDIPLQKFRQLPGDGKGVVEITSDHMSAGESGKFELDVIYYRKGNLVFDGPVNLSNALLYVEGGSLTVRGGGLSGTGAVIVDGDRVKIDGDTSLQGTNKVALITSGAVDLQGQGNFFQGIVYAKGAVSAKNITVLGNLIATDEKKGVSLDKARVVSSKDLGTIDFTSVTYSDARWLHSTGSVGPVPFRTLSDGNGNVSFTVDPGTYLTDGSICYPDPSDIFGSTNGNADWNALSQMNIDVDGISGGIGTGEGGMRQYVPEMLSALQTMQTQVTAIKSLTAVITALQAQIASMPDTVTQVIDPGPPPRTQQVPNADKQAKEAQLQQAIQARDEAYIQFNAARAQFYDNYNRYTNSNASSQGYKKGVKERGTRVERPVSIDPNQFRAPGADLLIKYWHVFNKRI